MVNRDQVMFYQFCDNCRIPPFTHHLKEAEIKIAYAFPFLREITEITKKIKSLYGFGGRYLNIRYVPMDWNHVSRSITWFSTLKASNLVKWQFFLIIDWLNFETRPSSLCNFAMAYCEKDALKKILSDFNGIGIRDRWSPLTNKDFKMYETGNGDGNGKEQ